MQTQLDLLYHLEVTRAQHHRPSGSRTRRLRWLPQICCTCLPGQCTWLSLDWYKTVDQVDIYIQDTALILKNFTFPVSEFVIKILLSLVCFDFVADRGNVFMEYETRSVSTTTTISSKLLHSRTVQRRSSRVIFVCVP